MDNAIVTGQFGPWRGVWMIGGFAALFLAASIKLATVDRELVIAAYPAGAAVICAGIAALLRRRSGTFRITKTEIAATRRNEPPIEVAIRDIRRVDVGTRKLPQLLIEHGGGTLKLPGISGRHKVIDALHALGVGG